MIHSSQAFHDEKYRNDPVYHASMLEYEKPTLCAQKLVNVLQVGSYICELGCGSGRNSVFLAKQGYSVDALDVSEVAFSDLRDARFQYHLENLIFPIHGDLKDFVSEKSYDAFIISYVLHFLSVHEAEHVIREMQKSTHSEGYNALECMIDGNRKQSEGKFYPPREVLLSLYTGWKPCYENTFSRRSSDGIIRHRLCCIFQK